MSGEIVVEVVTDIRTGEVTEIMGPGVPPPPAPVGRLALRVALAELGKLEAAEAAVASGPVAVRMAWGDPGATFAPDGLVAGFLADALGIGAEGVTDVLEKANGLRF